MKHTLYITLIGIVYIFPALYLLIHHKFRKKYHLPLLSTTIFIASLPFIIWEYIALTNSFWWFDKRLITGLELFSIPIEEYLFFIVIPQSCLFLWVVSKICTSKKGARKFFFHHLENNN